MEARWEAGTANPAPIITIGRTRSRSQTPLCLRQHGTSHLLFIVSLVERNNEQ